jgi:hypothetical protein
LNPSADEFGRRYAWKVRLIGHGPRRVGVFNIVTDPVRAAVRDRNLHIGLTVGLAPLLFAVGFARRASSGDDIRTDRVPFGLVTVEECHGSGALEDESEFPREVISVLDAGVHSLTAGRWMDVSGITSDKHAAVAITFRESHADAEQRGSTQVLQARFGGQHPLGDGL